MSFMKTLMEIVVKNALAGLDENDNSKEDDEEENDE